MKLNIKQVEQYLNKISSSSPRTFQANISQFLDYIRSQISADNQVLKQYIADRNSKWSNWPSQQYWEMPLNVTEARSLSFDLYNTIAEKGSDFQASLYVGDNFGDAIYQFNRDFLDHFFQAIQEINNCEPGVDLNERKEVTVDSAIVFVVHGRNEKLRKAMFEFLRAIGLSPLEWSKLLLMTGEVSPYVGKVLETAFTQAQAIIVLLTADDEVKLREEFISSSDADYEKTLTGQARPNVLFEGGMAMGRHPERTVFVQIGDVRPFSDILGRHIIKMNNDLVKRQDLANRLKTAGCLITLEGTDWHNSGDFSL
jgi:predicted nucleotide-binding protein